MIRRKSHAQRAKKDCRYYRQQQHEQSNQSWHERQQADNPSHDPLADCWCCCDDCTELTWYPEG